MGTESRWWVVPQLLAASIPSAAADPASPAASCFSSGVGWGKGWLPWWPAVPPH